MPNLHVTTALPWQSGASLHGTPLAAPWQSGVTLHSLGGTYTPPSAPPGGTPGVPSTDPRYTIAARSSYPVAHTMTVTDLRDGAALQVDSVTMSNDEDALFWSLSMSGGPALLAKLADGDQPSSVEVTLDGQVWRFLVDSVSRSRTFPDATVQVRGRSLTSAAGRPYEYEKTWSIDGDTTAAQIAASANILTGMNVIWALADWPVPDRVFSFFGTPLQVVKRVAESVGAMVLSDRKDYTVRVLPRYSLLPNEWSTAAPDVEIALAALSTEAFERADRPEYDGVYVLGQQQGAAAFVRLAGTSGLNQHPLVTDLLLTDTAACSQRAAAVLGSSGQQQRHTISLPVLTGTGEPGVLDVGWLARIVEPGGPTWYGMVRSVSVSAQLPIVEQTVVLERHTKPIDGTTEGTVLPPALLFTGPIPNQTFLTGATFNVPLAGYWSLGVPPYAYSLRSGTLPAWATLNPATGALTGTAPGAPAAATALQVRATDSINSTADSNSFTLQVISSGPPRSTYFGEDVQNSTSTPLSSTPNADAARDSFLAAAATAGRTVMAEQDFESYAASTPAPISYSRTSGAATVVTTLSGTGTIGSVTPGTASLGRYSIPSASSSKYWRVTAATSGASTLITFDQDVYGAGFYCTDVGDFGGQLEVKLLDAADTVIETFVVPNTDGTIDSDFDGFPDTPNDGSALYFSILASGAGDRFRKIQINNPTVSDVFGLDRLVVVI